MSLFHPGVKQGLSENISKQKLKARRKAEKRFYHSTQNKDSRRVKTAAVFPIHQYNANLAQPKKVNLVGNDVLDKLQACSQEDPVYLSSNLPCFMLSNKFRHEFNRDVFENHDILPNGYPPPKIAKLRATTKVANLTIKPDQITLHASNSEKLGQFTEDLSEPSKLTVCNFSPKFRTGEKSSRIECAKPQSILTHQNPSPPRTLNTAGIVVDKGESGTEVSLSQIRNASNRDVVKAPPTEHSSLVKTNKIRVNKGNLNGESTESLEIHHSEISTTDNSRMYPTSGKSSSSEKDWNGNHAFLEFRQHAPTSQSFLDLLIDLNDRKTENWTIPRLSANIKSPIAVYEAKAGGVNVYTSQLPEENGLELDPYDWAKYVARPDSVDGENVSLFTPEMQTSAVEIPPDNPSEVFTCPPGIWFYSFLDTAPQYLCGMMSLVTVDNTDDCVKEFSHPSNNPYRQIFEPLIYEVIDEDSSSHTKIPQENAMPITSEINDSDSILLEYRKNDVNNNQVPYSTCNIIAKSTANIYPYCQSPSEMSIKFELKTSHLPSKRPRKSIRKKKFHPCSLKAPSHKRSPSCQSDITRMKERSHSHNRAKASRIQGERLRKPEMQTDMRNSKNNRFKVPYAVTNCDYKHRKRKEEKRKSLWQHMKSLFFCCTFKINYDQRHTMDGNHGIEYKPKISLFERIIIWWRRKTRRRNVVRATSKELLRMRRRKFLQETQEFYEDSNLVSRNVRSKDTNNRLNRTSTFFGQVGTKVKAISSEGCLVIQS